MIDAHDMHSVSKLTLYLLVKLSIIYLFNVFNHLTKQNETTLIFGSAYRICERRSDGDGVKTYAYEEAPIYSFSHILITYTHTHAVRSV